MVSKMDKCVWKYWYDWRSYISSCGFNFDRLNADNLNKNYFIYCPKCGKEIEEDDNFYTHEPFYQIED